MHDLIVIGGGPAGYYAAELAGKAGFSVLLVEKEQLGGVCLNEGCIPSKTLLHCSKLFASAKTSEKFGVRATDASFDFAAVMARKKKVVDAMRGGLAFTLKKYNVETVPGRAVILPQNADAFVVDVNGMRYEAARLLIATGAQAAVPSIPGVDRPFVCTNREILDVASIPPRFAVIGAGAIGLELATFFAEAGSAVTVIEMLPHIGGTLDKDIGSALKRELEKKGIAFFLQSRVAAIAEHCVEFESGGNPQSAAADVVLISIGRRPVISGFGLEAVNVACVNGAIATDARGRTSVAGIWAAGDVNGVSMLAHTAYREAQACVNDMLGVRDEVDYRAIASVIYTHPEAATVGLTKEEAISQGIDAVEAKLPLTYNGRYVAETDGERGVIKAVVEAKTHRILGVHMLGGHCSEMIFGAAAMIGQGLHATDVVRMAFPHPTVSEIIKDVLSQIE